MAYALQRYYDPQRRAVICVHTDDWYNTKPHNDYWEKSRGEYNGYLTAMLYEALVWMEKLERLVYEDAKKAADYRRVAEEIRVQFNKPLDEGGFWSPNRKPISPVPVIWISVICQFRAVRSRAGWCRGNGRKRWLLRWKRITRYSILVFM